jgi:hypothetical protein
MKTRSAKLVSAICFSLFTCLASAGESIAISTPYSKVTAGDLQRFAQPYQKARFQPPQEALRREVCGLVFQRISNGYLTSHWEPQKWRGKAKEFFDTDVAPRIDFAQVRDAATTHALYLLNYLRNPSPPDPKEYYEKVLKKTSAIKAFPNVEYWITSAEHARKNPSAEKALHKMLEMRTLDDFYALGDKDGAAFGAFKRALADNLLATNNITDEQISNIARQFCGPLPTDKQELRRGLGDTLLKLGLLNVIRRDVTVHDPAWREIFPKYLEDEKKVIEDRLKAAGINPATLKLTLFEEP